MSTYGKAYNANHKSIRASMQISLTFKLELLKGNKHPYFSITGEARSYTGKPGRPARLSCGCVRDSIQEITKDKYADAIALHLADITGAPMYALENGLYWLGSSKYQAYSLEHTMRHFRVTKEEAERIKSIYDTQGKQGVSDYIDNELRPRWRVEAQQAILKYNLIPAEQVATVTAPEYWEEL